ncbi:MAG: PilZ domain-containing protein [Candidatus Omnitrophica bacterium]|nr:PilZ domain-containing protein [Candidatus Omnitrophota bacterium]
MAFAERRAFPRLACNAEVDYTIISAPKQAANPTIQSKDISAGGIRIVTLEKLNPETMLDLKFWLPDSREAISAAGKVVWAEEFTVGNLKSSKACETGVEFISISEEDREKIKQFVIERL